MLRREVTICNRLGLHARAAARFVHAAGRFQARVTIEREGQVVDGKSILGLLLLAATRGTALQLTVSGEDEHVALRTLTELVESGFEEGAAE